MHREREAERDRHRESINSLVVGKERVKLKGTQNI